MEEYLSQLHYTLDLNAELIERNSENAKLTSDVTSTRENCMRRNDDEMQYYI